MITNMSKRILAPFLIANNNYMASQYVASIDQSTTATKFSIFETTGRLIDKQIIQHRQITPQEGWLEHDPLQIIANTNQAIQNVLDRLTSPNSPDPEFSVSKLQGVGICNQRETVICWDEDGKPLYNAIVWCDSRTKQICDDFKKKYGDFKLLTGLPVSPYFSLFKVIWLAESVPEIKQRILQGKIKIGTVDSWLVYNLTKRYITDASNASRTYLCNLSGEWDESLLKLFKMKKDFLPEIVGSFQSVGEIRNGPLTGIPVCSVMGDQQSSAFAHGLKKDQMKITYGTGCFMLSNIGTEPEIHDSFITTILNKKQDKFQYAYEASVECGGGTLNWAQRAELFEGFSQLNNLPRLTNQELFFYPSFGSIFAPFWKTGVKGTFTGLNYNVNRQQMLQAILESIAYRLYDNIKAPQFQGVKQIFVDGGMTSNKQFMQFQADTFNKKIRVRQLDTCWGVAKGVLVSKNIQFKEIQQHTNLFTPDIDHHKEIIHRYGRWSEERNRLYSWRQQQQKKQKN